MLLSLTFNLHDVGLVNNKNSTYFNSYFSSLACTQQTITPSSTSSWAGNHIKLSEGTHYLLSIFPAFTPTASHLTGTVGWNIGIQNDLTWRIKVQVVSHVNRKACLHISARIIHMIRMIDVEEAWQSPQLAQPSLQAIWTDESNTKILPEVIPLAPLWEFYRSGTIVKAEPTSATMQKQCNLSL